jgi:hypothetical protein
MRYLLICICAAFLVLLSADAAIYTVRPDGTGDFATIQDAVNAVEDGDVIQLTAGEFTGYGNRDINLQGKAILVRSQNSDPLVCTINCEGSSSSPHRGFILRTGEGPDTIIEGIRIINGYADGGNDTGIGGAILCRDGVSPTFRRLILEDNFAEYIGGGIQVTYASAELYECTFIYNRSYQFAGGLNCHQGEATLTNCTFVRNAGPQGGGVRSSRSDVYLVNTIIAFGLQGSAVRCDNDGEAYLTCCDLYDNAGGDYVNCALGQHGQDGNIEMDPRFCDMENGDYRLNDESPCAPFSPPNDECDLIGAWPAGCGTGEPQTYLIRPDGTGDFPTIQAAIAAAGTGDVIMLADGVFRGDGNRDLELTWRQISVVSESGNPEACIIDCEGREDDPHRGFKITTGAGSGSRLEGFTIRNQLQIRRLPGRAGRRAAVLGSVPACQGMSVPAKPGRRRSRRHVLLWQRARGIGLPVHKQRVLVGTRGRHLLPRGSPCLSALHRGFEHGSAGRWHLHE